MIRTRSLAARALGLVAAFGLLAGVLAVTAAPAQSATRWAYVYGYVQNQLGQYQDGVVVELLNEDGTVKATQLTYEGEDQDHGFYNLSFKFDNTKTYKYKLRFSSAPGSADPFKTQTLGTTIVVDKKNDFVFVEDVMMQLDRKVDTTTTLKAPSKVEDHQKKEASVTVSTPELKKLEGKVEVVVSRNAGKKTETALDKKYELEAVKKTVGTSTVGFTLPKLASPGAPKCKEWNKKKTVCKEYKKAESHTWDVTVTFLGNSLAKKSRVTTTIESWAKGHTPAQRARPNALL